MSVRVLVVEDEEVAAEAHATYVGRVPGFELAGVARSAGEAVQLIDRDDAIDLILLDMHLPDGHGLGLLQRVRAAGRQVDVIAVTSARDTEVARRGMAAPGALKSVMSGPVPSRADPTVSAGHAAGLPWTMSEPPPEPVPEPVPPGVRAQILATEHWGLLAVRSQTWSEVIGRITSQLMFTSASLLFLALAGQAMSYSSTFRLLAILLGLTLLTAGTLTSFRVHNASQEDYLFIKGMNRLRAAYVDIDPTLAPYFITGLHDDDAGIGRTYDMGIRRRNAGQILASSAMFIIVVNTLIAAGVTAFVLWPWGPAPTAIGAVVVGTAHFAAWIWLGYRSWQVNIDPAHVRFPTPGD